MTEVLYRDKEWLYNQYIIENKNATEIGEEFSLSVSGIRNYIKKFGFKKSYDDLLAAKHRQMKKTLKQNYGVDTPLASKAIKNKKERTCTEKFGVKNPMKNDVVKSSYKETMRERYGVESPLMSADIRFKYEETCAKRYGHSVPTKNPDVMAKMKSTVLDKYGVDWISKSEEIKGRVINTLYENGNISFIDGVSLLQFAKEEKVPYSTLLNAYKEPHFDKVSFLDNYKNNISSLEYVSSKLFGVDFYNKKFDINDYSELNYRPDFKLSDSIAINVDGLYWHSEANIADKFYHFNMRKEYEDLGLRIFQFRSDEIRLKPQITQSIVNHAMSNTSIKIGARKTKIINVSQVDADIFYVKNHMMGSRKAKHIGLVYNDEIVMMLSYIIKNKNMKIERMSSKVGTSVIGGFSKLLSYLKSKSNYKSIDYWVDLRYGTGNFLLNHGFSLKKDTLGWKWTDFKKTYNRLKCRANMDERKLSEKDHAKELGWVKIYDAGQRLYRKEV